MEIKMCKDCKFLEENISPWKIDCYFWCRSQVDGSKVNPEDECTDPVYLFKKFVANMKKNNEVSTTTK